MTYGELEVTPLYIDVHMDKLPSTVYKTFYERYIANKTTFPLDHIRGKLTMFAGLFLFMLLSKFSK